MTARTVTGTVEFPGGSGVPCVGARVRASLYAGDTESYASENELSVGVVATLTDHRGMWALELEPNDNVTPAGTVWRIEIRPPDRPPSVSHIEVPDTAGPHDYVDLLTDAPGETATRPLAAHIATVAAHGSQRAFMLDPRSAPWNAAGDGVTDDTAALNAFFAHTATDADAPAAFVGGTFAVSGKVTIGPASGENATLHHVGNMYLVATQAIDTVVEVRNSPGLVWTGLLDVTGTGGTTYASRTCRVGVHLSDFGRMSFTGIRARRFSEWGVLVTGSGALESNSSLTHLGAVRASDCGSGRTTSGASRTASWSSRSDSGSSGSTDQRTTITVSTLPPTTVAGNGINNVSTYDGASYGTVVALIDGEPHYIYGVDPDASTVTVYPWIDLNLTSGTVTYLLGGGVGLYGGDANVIGLDSLDAVRCGHGLFDGALYGPVVSRVVTQACAVGLTIGQSPSAASVGGQVNGLYCENNTFDLLRVTRGVSNLVIASEYAFSFGKVAVITAPRVTSSNLLSNAASVANSLVGVVLQSGGVWHEYKEPARNAGQASSSFALDVTRPRDRGGNAYKRDSWTVNLQTPDLNLNQWFGFGTGSLFVFGTGSNREPTGTITFNPPSGWTVNGGSSAAFSGLTAPTQFFVCMQVDLLDFVVIAK